MGSLWRKVLYPGWQGTPEIDIYIGWVAVKIILTVTDSFGCVTMCMGVLSCELTQIPLTGLEDANNPELNNATVTQILDQYQVKSGQPLQLSV